jgi:hypothetical protein
MTVARASIRPTPMLTHQASASRVNAVTLADRRGVSAARVSAANPSEIDNP